ncbi:hypothetical protein [Streptomyces erythrochromogenes]|uniref:hypothetical protein n=1 Tax=Streptomyces erythrochromogenes TaxID=285574 RepID=UPI003826AD90
MLAAGQGIVLASRFSHRAHAEAGWFLYAPTCALVEADRARPTPEHPDGAIVATTFPKRWEGEPVRVLDLGD